ncbi:MAG: class I SAM-dependent methyltransferase [SAR202 cluster bacterium]|nr:class I SAM-dependent methyltransferase [SAR202 cluster bacterium]
MGLLFHYQELEERYDQWATEYDADLENSFVWLAPKMVADVFAEHVKPTAHVLDAGAGTGMSGEALAELGFNNIVAMDLSQGMLDEAKNKNVYVAFDQMALGGDLAYETDSFDGVVLVGVFTLGHAPASSLDELIRVTKPGGCIAFSIRVDMTQGGDEFPTKFASLEKAGKWKLAKTTEPYKPLPKGEPDVFHQVWAFQVA